jgi:hypothetical protein
MWAISCTSCAPEPVARGMAEFLERNAIAGDPLAVTV